MPTVHYAGRKPSYYARYLDRFGEANPPFLDIGAGMGLILELATQRGIECCGVELKKGRVDACVAKGLDVRQHDICDPLPFPDNHFGMIYCGQVVEHLPPATQKMMTAEAYRVLKPGGLFQICSPCRHSEFHRNQTGHDFILTPKELLSLLQQAGFKKFKDINYPQKVPEIPPEVMTEIWLKYRPDILSESASYICWK